MRLFLAIDVPDHVKRSLQSIQHSGLGIRWTTPETIHLTLRFIGEVEPDIKDELLSSLKQVKGQGFEMTIDGLGYFPPRKFPKVVWAGVEENENLMELQNDIETACRNVDLVEPDKRPFKPHITIGRVNDASKKEVLSYINRHKKLRIEGIPVEEFILYESKLHPDGAVHTPLHRFSLEPGSDNN